MELWNCKCVNKFHNFADERNRHNLELLERCLCVVCIDDDALPATFNNPLKKEDRWIGDRDYANVLHQALHGGGSRHLGANRWFDKTFHAILGTVRLKPHCIITKSDNRFYHGNYNFQIISDGWFIIHILRKSDSSKPNWKKGESHFFLFWVVDFCFINFFFTFLLRSLIWKLGYQITW